MRSVELVSFQIVTAKKKIDYDELATAVICGLSSDRKPPKLLGQVNDIRSFLDSLATLHVVRNYHTRDLISELFFSNFCYTGRCEGISDDDLMDGLHSLADILRAS